MLGKDIHMKRSVNVFYNNGGSAHLAVVENGGGVGVGMRKNVGRVQEDVLLR